MSTQLNIISLFNYFRDKLKDSIQINRKAHFYDRPDKNLRNLEENYNNRSKIKDFYRQVNPNIKTKDGKYKPLKLGLITKTLEKKTYDFNNLINTIQQIFISADVLIADLLQNTSKAVINKGKYETLHYKIPNILTNLLKNDTLNDILKFILTGFLNICDQICSILDDSKVDINGENFIRLDPIKENKLRPILFYFALYKKAFEYYINYDKKTRDTLTLDTLIQHLIFKNQESKLLSLTDPTENPILGLEFSKENSMIELIKNSNYQLANFNYKKILNILTKRPTDDSTLSGSDTLTLELVDEDSSRSKLIESTRSKLIKALNTINAMVTKLEFEGGEMNSKSKEVDSLFNNNQIKIKKLCDYRDFIMWLEEKQKEQSYCRLYTIARTEIYNFLYELDKYFKERIDKISDLFIVNINKQGVIILQIRPTFKTENIDPVFKKFKGLFLNSQDNIFEKELKDGYQKNMNLLMNDNDNLCRKHNENNIEDKKIKKQYFQEDINKCDERGFYFNVNFSKLGRVIINNDNVILYEVRKPKEETSFEYVWWDIFGVECLNPYENKNLKYKYQSEEFTFAGFLNNSEFQTYWWEYIVNDKPLTKKKVLVRFRYNIINSKFEIYNEELTSKIKQTQINDYKFDESYFETLSNDLLNNIYENPDLHNRHDYIIDYIDNFSYNPIIKYVNVNDHSDHNSDNSEYDPDDVGDNHKGGTTYYRIKGNNGNKGNKGNYGNNGNNGNKGNYGNNPSQPKYVNTKNEDNWNKGVYYHYFYREEKKAYWCRGNTYYQNGFQYVLVSDSDIEIKNPPSKNINLSYLGVYYELNPYNRSTNKYDLKTRNPYFYNLLNLKNKFLGYISYDGEYLGVKNPKNYYSRFIFSSNDTNRQYLILKSGRVNEIKDIDINSTNINDKNKEFLAKGFFFIEIFKLVSFYMVFIFVSFKFLKNKKMHFEQTTNNLDKLRKNSDYLNEDDDDNFYNDNILSEYIDLHTETKKKSNESTKEETDESIKPLLILWGIYQANQFINYFRMNNLPSFVSFNTYYFPFINIIKPPFNSSNQNDDFDKLYQKYIEFIEKYIDIYHIYDDIVNGLVEYSADSSYYYNRLYGILIYILNIFDPQSFKINFINFKLNIPDKSEFEKNNKKITNDMVYQFIKMELYKIYDIYMNFTKTPYNLEDINNIDNYIEEFIKDDELGSINITEIIKNLKNNNDSKENFINLLKASIGIYDILVNIQNHLNNPRNSTKKNAYNFIRDVLNPQFKKLTDYYNDQLKKYFSSEILNKYIKYFDSQMKNPISAENNDWVIKHENLIKLIDDFVRNINYYLKITYNLLKFTHDENDLLFVFDFQFYKEILSLKNFINWNEYNNIVNYYDLLEFYDNSIDEIIISMDGPNIEFYYNNKFSRFFKIDIIDTDALSSVVCSLFCNNLALTFIYTFLINQSFDKNFVALKWDIDEYKQLVYYDMNNNKVEKCFTNNPEYYDINNNKLELINPNSYTYDGKLKTLYNVSETKYGMNPRYKIVAVYFPNLDINIDFTLKFDNNGQSVVVPEYSLNNTSFLMSNNYLYLEIDKYKFSITTINFSSRLLIKDYTIELNYENTNENMKILFSNLIEFPPEIPSEDLKINYINLLVTPFPINSCNKYQFLDSNDNEFVIPKSKFDKKNISLNSLDYFPDIKIFDVNANEIFKNISSSNENDNQFYYKGKDNNTYLCEYIDDCNNIVNVIYYKIVQNISDNEYKYYIYNPINNQLYNSLFLKKIEEDDLNKKELNINEEMKKNIKRVLPNNLILNYSVDSSTSSKINYYLCDIYGNKIIKADKHTQTIDYTILGDSNTRKSITVVTFKPVDATQEYIQSNENPTENLSWYIKDDLENELEIFNNSSQQILDNTNVKYAIKDAITYDKNIAILEYIVNNYNQLQPNYYDIENNNKPNICFANKELKKLLTNLLDLKDKNNIYDIVRNEDYDMGFSEYKYYCNMSSETTFLKLGLNYTKNKFDIESYDFKFLDLYGNNLMTEKNSLDVDSLYYHVKGYTNVLYLKNFQKNIVFCSIVNSDYDPSLSTNLKKPMFVKHVYLLDNTLYVYPNKKNTIKDCLCGYTIKYIPGKTNKAELIIKDLFNNTIISNTDNIVLTSRKITNNFYFCDGISFSYKILKDEISATRKSNKYKNTTFDIIAFKTSVGKLNSEGELVDVLNQQNFNSYVSRQDSTFTLNNVDDIFNVSIKELIYKDLYSNTFKIIESIKINNIDIPNKVKIQTNKDGDVIDKEFLVKYVYFNNQLYPIYMFDNKNKTKSFKIIEPNGISVYDTIAKEIITIDFKTNLKKKETLNDNINLNDENIISELAYIVNPTSFKLIINIYYLIIADENNPNNYYDTYGNNLSEDPDTSLNDYIILTAKSRNNQQKLYLPLIPERKKLDGLPFYTLDKDSKQLCYFKYIDKLKIFELKT